mmetsp:Transcript_29488/g.80961  ORF Transcript_29488/g.80961 Transcript_29488/m.80961 type:complete len:239 (+) Transcript_29488:414-1130(+)
MSNSSASRCSTQEVHRWVPLKRPSAAARSNIARKTLGMPAKMYTLRMETRGQGLPSGGHSTVEPSGTWAILWCPASSDDWRRKGRPSSGAVPSTPPARRRSIARRAPSSTRGRPKAAATPAMVRSSCVGPKPPEVKASSQASDTRRTLAAMAATSSGTTSMQVTATPRPWSSSQRYLALVSCTFPFRISFPMTTMPAVRGSLLLDLCNRSPASSFAPLLPDVRPARSKAGSRSSCAGA